MCQLRFLLYIAIFFLAACKQEPRSVERGEVVNVYTACYQETDEQLFKAFEKSTGIKVNIIYDDNSNLINKLQQRGTQPGADVLILKGICHLRQARNDSLLQSTSQKLEVTYSTRSWDSTNHWYTLTYDPLVIAYVQNNSITQPPATYAELIQAQWKGKLLLPDDQDFLQSLAVAMLADKGEEATLEWLDQYKENLAPEGVTPKVFSRMITDSARIALLTASEYATASKPPNIKIVFPNQADNGTYALVKGVSLVRHAPHPTHARRLLSFLLNTEIQRTYAQAHWEYPINADIQASSSLQALGHFQLNTTSINASGQYCDRAMLLLQEAGF